MTGATKRQSPWIRVLVEGVVIVGSILMAFGIDAWWEDRGDRAIEHEILQLVTSEMNANRTELASVIENHDEQLAGIDRFLQATPSDLLLVPSDSVAGIVRSLLLVVTFNANEEAANLLTQTPLVSREGLSTRASVARYLRAWSDATEEHPVLQSVQSDVIRLLAPYATREAGSGRASVVQMVARRGPTVPYSSR